ncbi:Protein Jade-1 [Mortierella sp. AM989]|nr:Protein Jade-1 [Mortierella sp. AM989]
MSSNESRCDIPVHQKCYGVKVVPEGNWYCQRCEDRITVNNTPCCCCPQKSGAFKRSTIPNQYIHVACARLHPDLDDTTDPIAFDPSLATKQVCSLCKSDYGVCSECSIDSCTRVMHVTCAQNESLTTKGKNTSLFCDLHRDIGALSRIMKHQQRKEAQPSTPSSSSGSTAHRSTKRSKSYRETSSDSEDYDEDEYESDSDEEARDPTIEDESEDDHRLNKSAQSSSASSTPGSKGSSRLKRSVDTIDKRRRDRSSESEEIDVDDSEAILGSSTGGSSSSAHRKKLKAAKPAPKESPAESQRRRLLMTLDKSKKKQGVSALNNVNLSSLPIRTLGGIGIAASTSMISGSGNGGETKQKLPGISRINYNIINSTNNNNGINNISGADTNPNPYAASNIAPSLGSLELPGNGSSQNSNRGLGEGLGKNLKGLTFSLDSSIDASSFKTPSPLPGSISPSPSFSNAGSPVHARLGDKQQQSPKSGAVSEESRDMQAIIRNLQGKIANYESTMQAMNAQIQQLQQQLTNSNITASTTSTTSTSASTAKGLNPLALAKPHTIGPPGQDLQYRFDELQHTHTEEKKRSSTLRQNLKDVFGILQVPVAQSSIESIVEWNGDKLDDYVQALRDAVVGAEPVSLAGTSVRSVLDVKRRDLVVDRVLKEMGSSSEPLQ